MSASIWRRALVLGGIRSGKSAFAEGLVATAEHVRYVATARRDPADAAWTARIETHRRRRAGTWSTVEVGEDPLALLGLLMRAGSGDTVLVDDLGTWLAAVVEINDRVPAIAAGLAEAVRACASVLVLVSPEVGLSVVPPTRAGRVFADALGSTNQAVAAECDAVTLVIAGNAVPVKGTL
jgi:nicotinate-nucleotide--dimethylbenzimidazole phosphoribosyltransferase